MHTMDSHTYIFSKIFAYTLTAFYIYFKSWAKNIFCLITTQLRIYQTNQRCKLHLAPWLKRFPLWAAQHTVSQSIKQSINQFISQDKQLRIPRPYTNNDNSSSNKLFNESKLYLVSIDFSLTSDCASSWSLLSTKFW